MHQGPSDRSPAAAKGLLLCLVSLFCTAAHAVQFSVLEEQYNDGPIITDIYIKDVLGLEPKPHLKIDPDRNAEHRKLVDILKPGFPFNDVSVRDQAAEILAGFPQPCRATMAIAIAVGPISDIDRFVPGVTDKRRVVGMYIGTCIEEELPDCEYDRQDTGAIDFDLRAFLTVLNQCREAIDVAKRRGAAFVERARAEPATTMPAR